MLKALWFLAKASLLIAAIVWLIERPGKIEIEWLGYIVETSIGFATAILLACLVIWTGLYRFWRAFVSVPAVYRRYTISRNREKGYRAVTSGLVAVAAGDGRSADKHVRHAERMIPDAPLTRLLSAQTALMNGNAPKARRTFQSLLEDDSAAFFGLRGLLTETLQNKNYGEALALIRRAETLQPKRLWIIRTLFDLETRNGEWEKAGRTLRKAEKLGIFDTATAARHRQALLTAQADGLLRQGNAPAALRAARPAFEIDPAFTPAAVCLAGLYAAAGKKRAALKTTEKSWRANPHPDLTVLWKTFMPPGKKSLSVYDAGQDAYLWMKKLTDLNPGHRDSHRALGTAALQARLWRPAREHLIAAMDYKVLARLEIEESRDDAKSRAWLETAAESPSEPKWTCTDCGHAETAWSALCPHCGGFNRQEWIIQGNDMHFAPRQRLSGFENGVIGPPA